MQTTQDGIKELMKPRYLVIADYPESEFTVGYVIECNIPETLDDGAQMMHEFSGWLESGLNNYPHLFKKLEWWEERKNEEMPKYVRLPPNGYVHPVSEYKIVDGVIYIINSDYNKWYMLENMKPATEQEYTDFINKNK